MWGRLEEDNYQRLIKNLQENGDRDIIFNGIKGKLSLLIESMKIVRSMCNEYK